VNACLSLIYELLPEKEAVCSSIEQECKGNSVANEDFNDWGV
jgi:hypothetical protein